MDSKIDYTQHTEPELVDMFARLDPRYAPEECTRLGEYLGALGYEVTAGTTGPGSASPSPEKLQELIGSTSPFQCQVDFDPKQGFLSFIGWTRNEFGFVGSGTLITDGIYVWISGRVMKGGSSMSLLDEHTQLSCHRIANVESADRLVRFEYNVLDVRGDAIFLWLADSIAVARLVQILPGRKTKEFRAMQRHPGDGAARQKSIKRT